MELVFDEQISKAQLDAFAALGGRIDHVFRAVSYGWTGSVPTDAAGAIPAAMGNSLRIVRAAMPAELHLDEATRGGRVRPVWVAGFAGSATGFSGSSQTTIAVVDSGVDDTHPDLAGRMEYWKDFSGKGETEPRDVVQHGSHVAGIAVGSGAAFGIGPGTLAFTDSGDLSSVPPGYGFASPIHLPPGGYSHEGTAFWIGGGNATLHVASRSDGSTGRLQSIRSAGPGDSPLRVAGDVTGVAAQHFTALLAQNETATLRSYAVRNSVAGYPAVGDGFPALRGVASGAKWASAKVISDDGTGSNFTIGAALDDLVVERQAHRIKVVNMSLGMSGTPGIDVTLRAKVNTMVDNGMVVVCSAGNDGPGADRYSEIDDPGRAALALTVGASNDANMLTTYTSSGFAVPSSSEDSKPDLIAPGGSSFYSLVLSVDSNDGDTPALADQVPDDYRGLHGTSMAAPFASGAAALVIDAMEKSGSSWSFADRSQPLFVKMMLCASATETNAAREVDSGFDPALGRAKMPKDRFEGYGLLNPDAAIEAVVSTYGGGPLGGSSDGGVFDRRAWGRRLELPEGPPVRLTLTVPPTADYDLYLVRGEPDPKGNPVILAASTGAGTGVDEAIALPTSPSPRYLFVKRVSGAGEWSLDSAPAGVVCGDSLLEGDENCDDGNDLDGDCCSSSCRVDEDGTACDDGLFCTETDTCTAGTCSGSGDPCLAGADCNDSCDEAKDDCVSELYAPCAGDSVVCSADWCDGNGSCVHPPGNAGTVCREATSACDAVETCSGTSTSCPADLVLPSAIVCRDAADGCDEVEFCTGLSKECPPDAVSVADRVCRAIKGPCDRAELCDGGTKSCPADAVLAAGTPCPSDDNECTDESCDGSSPLCRYRDNSAPCEDGAFCDGADRCLGGACLQHDGNPCPGPDGDEDCRESCDEASDRCDAVDPDASACDDGEPCTSDDRCHAGTCRGQASEPGQCGTTTTTLVPAACGDANGDGEITARDALLVLRGAIQASTCPLDVCDYTGDGELLASDALAILRRAVGQDVPAKCAQAMIANLVGASTMPITTTTLVDAR